MRFQQIFVTINMLMDHTASSPLLNRLGVTSSAKPTELASGKFFQSSDVVFPATTQAHHERLETAAQMKAMAKQNGPPAYLPHHDRRLLQVGNQDTTSPATTGATINSAPPDWTQQQVEQYNQAVINDFKYGKGEDLDGYWNKVWVAVGGSAALIVTAIALWWKCFRNPSGSGKDEPNRDDSDKDLKKGKGGCC